MADQEVVGTTAKQPKVKVVKAVKPKPEPKEPRFAKGWTAENWSKHLATMQRDAVPEGWLNMAVVCRKANEVEIKTTRLVTAAGGDRAGDDLWDQVFEVVYVGGRKFMSPEVLVKGFELLANPLYHPAHKGRVAKPKTPEQLKEIEEKAAAKAAKKAIKAAPAGTPEPWVAK